MSDSWDKVLRCRKCCLGSSPTGEPAYQIMIKQDLLLDQGNNPAINLGTAIVCPNRHCREIHEIKATGLGRDHGITIDMLKKGLQGFRTGHLTLKEWKGEVKPPEPPEALFGPSKAHTKAYSPKPMEYNPDGYIEPKGNLLDEPLF